MLGTIFTLNGNTHAEFQARLDAGWSKFFSLKRLLLKRDADVRKRLKLFNATISKTVLWCAESWKLTVEEKKRLRATQRSMLRKMVCPNRRPDEDYISWIKRATKKAEEKARAAGVGCWVEAFLTAKWRWAHKIMNMALDRWTSRTTKWRDSHWCFVQGSRPLRVRPGRFMKWEDDLRQYAASETWINWQEKAQDPLTWNAHESKYVKWAWR